MSYEPRTIPVEPDYYARALYELAINQRLLGWKPIYNTYNAWSKEHQAWWIRYIEREAKKGQLPMAVMLTQEAIRQRLMS